MNFVSAVCRFSRPLAGVVVLGVVATMPHAAVAQVEYDGPSSFYIDGSTPVDPRTRALVDAHFDHLQEELKARAEERERIERFIYHDNNFNQRQLGRF